MKLITLAFLLAACTTETPAVCLCADVAMADAAVEASVDAAVDSSD